VAVEEFDTDELDARFHAAHERAHGYRLDAAVELVTLRATATVGHELPPIGHQRGGGDERRSRDVSFDGEFRETPVRSWDGLASGTTLDGPAIVAGGESTVVVPPGWSLAVDERGTLRLEGDS